MSSLDSVGYTTCTSYVSIRKGQIHHRTVANCDIEVGQELSFTHVYEITTPKLIIRQEPVKAEAVDPSALQRRKTIEPIPCVQMFHDLFTELEMVSPYIYCLVSLVDKDTSSVMKDPSMSDDAVLKGMTTSSVLKLKDQDKRDAAVFAFPNTSLFSKEDYRDTLSCRGLDWLNPRLLVEAGATGVRLERKVHDKKPQERKLQPMRKKTRRKTKTRIETKAVKLKISIRMTKEESTHIRRKLQTLWDKGNTAEVSQIISELEKRPEVSYIDVKESLLPAMLRETQRSDSGGGEFELKERITALQRKWKWET